MQDVVFGLHSIDEPVKHLSWGSLFNADSCLYVSYYLKYAIILNIYNIQF